ncbi:phage tail protein [Amycolatopsis sp. SID8362]|uniref:phage tail protein n=1 Tax=Amycolatopsis sp. SID8362 TaxID=2690346 RepID=UPI0013685E1A|nr:phage tail protein [Amycolatopsis sp. SID8362]NBH06053.1 phage tail protein [Amycolatopsis sp. SID8362]NED42752.1 phage tail protein [Amycolatopsis sp. SID8362]
MTSMNGNSAHAAISAARFVISVTGLAGDSTNIAFSELSGIKMEVEEAEYVSATKSGISLAKLYGKTKPCEVSLKRGLDQDSSLWMWHQLVQEKSPSARKSCSLLLQDSAGNTKATYHLENAWPSKLDVDGLKAGSSETVKMSVVLKCDSIHFSPGVRV